MAYRLIGTGTTDAQGVARCSNNYVGTGKGEVDFIASTDNPIVEGSLQSEIYEICDCGFYDEATESNHKTTSSTYSNGSYANYNNLINVEYSSNGTKLSVSENTGRHFYYNDTVISTTKINGVNTILNNSAIEFELTEVTGTIDVYLTDGTNSRGVGLTSTGNYKIVVDGEIIHLYKDGVEQPLSGTVTMTGTNIRLSFYLNSADESMTFRELKIYPI